MEAIKYKVISIRKYQYLFLLPVVLYLSSCAQDNYKILIKNNKKGISNCILDSTNFRDCARLYLTEMNDLSHQQTCQLIEVDGKRVYNNYPVVVFLPPGEHKFKSYCDSKWTVGDGSNTEYGGVYNKMTVYGHWESYSGDESYSGNFEANKSYIEKNRTIISLSSHRTTKNLTLLIWVGIAAGLVVLIF